MLSPSFSLALKRHSHFFFGWPSLDPMFQNVGLCLFSLGVTFCVRDMLIVLEVRHTSSVLGATCAVLQHAH